MQLKSRFQRPPRPKAFTLIELMVVIVIVGVLASLGLPAMTGYVRYTKTSEATANLNNLFKAAASFYSKERTDQGMSASTVTGCIAETTPIAATPTSNKHKFVATQGFTQLSFSIADWCYYGYGMTSIATAGTMVCGTGADQTDLYTFYARGDLDSDSIFSTFEMAAGSNSEGQLYHQRGFYVNLPIE